ncbi:hypothetical protein L218DRAFT_960516 [Marasmius fiardii PR-910]|nr:hypothetical protein L218DRAFT_960516 [Marasmius fiardii PR-910]
MSISLPPTAATSTAGNEFSTPTDSTASPTSDPSNVSFSTPSSPSNAGVIAGGVIGGVVLLALIVIAFILIRRRKSRMAPSSKFLAQNPQWRSGTPNSLSELNGDELPPFMQGSYYYPLAPEKQRRGSEVA